MFSRHRYLILLAVVLLAQVLALAYQVHKGRDVRLLREWSVLLVTPIEKGVDIMVSGPASLWRNYLDLRGARRENEELIRELNDIKLDYQRLRTEAEQARRLQVLLEFQQQVSSQTVAAQVISSGDGETSRLLVIDKGQEAGLRPDMPVIVPDGIVGKVLRVFPHAAQVLLITDGNSGAACLLESSRIHGVLRGQNKPLCALGYVVNDEKVEIGERVFTSGEDRIYPKGMPVGVVVEARPGASFQEISVQPFAKLNRLEEVLVVTKKVDVELSAPAAGSASAPGAQETQPASAGGVKPGQAAFVATPAAPQNPPASAPQNLSPP